MEECPPADDRERRLIEAVVSLAKSFREERDRLARRLAELEQQIDAYDELSSSLADENTTVGVG